MQQSLTDFERKKEILQFLSTSQKASVKVIAAKFDVSDITIRRDLQNLENEGKVTRYHGGAMIKEEQSSYPFKNQKNIAAKRSIGIVASKLIKPGDKIFLDCGSTISWLCQAIKDVPDITIITNSLPNLLALEESRAKINFVGGEYDKSRRAAHGHMANNHLKYYAADLAFIGVDGISLEMGCTSHTEVEIDNSKIMASQSKQSIVLCDATKFGKDAYIKMMDVSQVHTIITDNKVDKIELNRFRKAGLKVLVAPSS